MGTEMDDEFSGWDFDLEEPEEIKEPKFKPPKEVILETCPYCGWEGKSLSRHLPYCSKKPAPIKIQNKQEAISIPFWAKEDLETLMKSEWDKWRRKSKLQRKNIRRIVKLFDLDINEVLDGKPAKDFEFFTKKKEEKR